MAARGAIKAGEAFVELFTDDSEFLEGLKRAEDQLREFGSRINRIGRRVTALGSAGIAAGIAMATAFGKSGDKLQRISEKTGIAVESLGQLGFAAEQSGSSLDELGSAAVRIDKRLAKIVSGIGSQKQIKALDALGLDAKTLRDLDAEERLLEIADAIAAFKDPADAAFLAQTAFGNAIKDVLPLLMKGRNGIAELRQEAADLNIVLTDSETRLAADLTDANNRAKRSMRAVSDVIGSALAPMLIELNEIISEIAARTIQWVRANQEMVEIVALGTAALTAFGAALIGLGTSVELLAFGLSGIVEVLAASRAAFVALFTPMGAIVALAAAGVTVFFKFTRAGQETAELIGDSFNRMSDTVTDAIGGIRDALAAGDIKLAGEIMMTGLEVALREGIQPIREIWINFSEFIASTIVESIGLVAEAIVRAVGFVSRQIVKLEGLRRDAVEGVANKAAKEKIEIQTAKEIRELEAEKAAIQENRELTDAEKRDFALRRRLIDRNFIEGNRSIDDQTADAVAENRDKEQAALDKIKETQENLTDKIIDIAGGATGALGENAQAEIDKTRSELAKAQKELAKLIKDGKDGKDKSDDEKNARDRFKDLQTSKLELGIEGILGDGPATAGGGLSSRGAFNVRALAGLQQSSLARRQTELQTQIAENTKRTAENVEEGGSV